MIYLVKLRTWLKKMLCSRINKVRMRNDSSSFETGKYFLVQENESFYKIFLYFSMKYSKKKIYIFGFSRTHHLVDLIDGWRIFFTINNLITDEISTAAGHYLICKIFIFAKKGKKTEIFFFGYIFLQKILDSIMK